MKSKRAKSETANTVTDFPANASSAIPEALKLPSKEDIREAVQRGLEDQKQRREAADMERTKAVEAILASLPKIIQEETSLGVYETKWFIPYILQKEELLPTPGATPGPNAVVVQRCIYRFSEWRLVAESEISFPAFAQRDAAIAQFKKQLSQALKELGLEVETFSGRYDCHLHIYTQWKELVAEIQSAITEQSTTPPSPDKP